MKLAICNDHENVSLKLADWSSLGPEIEIDVYGDFLNEGAELAERLLPYDILVIMRERTPFPQSLIEGLSRLRLLVTTGPKNRGIDLEACRDRGIVVCGTESSRTAPAELAWALILSTVRRIPQHDQALRKGIWGDSIGSSLHDKVLGVVGLGKLGKQVARVGLAFGMKVVAWSQNMTGEQAAEAGAVRGNSIAGAGLDAFDIEPLPHDHPFLSLSNTVLTPHIGYVMEDSFRTYFTQAKEDVAAWLAGKPIRVLEE